MSEKQEYTIEKDFWTGKWKLVPTESTSGSAILILIILIIFVFMLLILISPLIFSLVGFKIVKSKRYYAGIASIISLIYLLVDFKNKWLTAYFIYGYYQPNNSEFVKGLLGPSWGILIWLLNIVGVFIGISLIAQSLGQKNKSISVRHSTPSPKDTPAQTEKNEHQRRQKANEALREAKIKLDAKIITREEFDSIRKKLVSKIENETGTEKEIITVPEVEVKNNTSSKWRSIIIFIAITVVLIVGVKYFLIPSKIQEDTSTEQYEGLNEGDLPQPENNGRDAEELKGIEIGTQIWASKNLDVTNFRNGDPIPQAKTFRQMLAANKFQKPAWCYYNFDSNSQNETGILYNWYAVNDPRGLTSEGWHIPTDDEWKILIDELGGFEMSGAKIKSSSGWKINGNGNNSSGFSGLPDVGYGAPFSDKFMETGESGNWWTSTESTSSDAWNYSVSYQNNRVYRDLLYKGVMMSVRCLKDTQNSTDSEITSPPSLSNFTIMFDGGHISDMVATTDEKYLITVNPETKTVNVYSAENLRFIKSYNVPEDILHKGNPQYPDVASPVGISLWGDRYLAITCYYGFVLHIDLITDELNSYKTEFSGKPEDDKISGYSWVAKFVSEGKIFMQQTELKKIWYINTVNKTIEGPLDFNDDLDWYNNQYYFTVNDVNSKLTEINIKDFNTQKVISKISLSDMRPDDKYNFSALLSPDNKLLLVNRYTAISIYSIQQNKRIFHQTRNSSYPPNIYFSDNIIGFGGTGVIDGKGESQLTIYDVVTNKIIAKLDFAHFGTHTFAKNKTNLFISRRTKIDENQFIDIIGSVKLNQLLNNSNVYYTDIFKDFDSKTIDQLKMMNENSSGKVPN